MHKLLIICGPTATGKTSLALKLAPQFNGEIISADSRQVYKFMDVVTGKDLPVNLKTIGKNIPYYSVDGVSLWGYDLVRPDEEWSVRHFLEFAHIIISDIQKRGKLSIVAGGTGLYLKALTEPMPFVSVSRNLGLRKKLMNESSSKLLQLLIKEWPERVAVMNESDRKNPRRLVRAIEIAELEKDSPFRTKRTVLQKFQEFDVLRIGLTINNRQELYDRIDRRVEQRLTPQLWKELEFLEKKGFLRAVPISTIGYRELIPFLKGEASREDAIQQWKFAEHGYARRQLVWFKKQPTIHWFDVTKEHHERRVVTLIRQWYDEEDART